MKRIGVLTSGGDAPGMNAAVRAVVRTGLNMGAEVFAIYEGYQGMVDGGEQIKPLSWNDVGGILHEGGTIIGTARCPDFQQRDGRLAAAHNLVKNKIDKLVIVGGDGSLTGADILRQEWTGLLDELVANGRITSEEAGPHRRLTIAGLPGSIDNDLSGTDMTIGADTALHRITDAVDAITSTAASHQRAFVVEVMGRNCGYLALMGALATGADWVLIPESPPNLDNWEDKMCEVLYQGRQIGRRDSIVIVAEGARDRYGTPITSSYVKQVLEERLGEDTRVTILGHVQRGGSPSVFDRNLSTLLGDQAVKTVLNDQYLGSAYMIAIRNNEITRVDLPKCLEQTREVAQAIEANDYDKAMGLRGGSFREAFGVLRTLVRAQPHEHESDQRRLRLAVVHGGAPAPGMNTAVRAAVRLGLDKGHVLLGVYNGFKGLVNNEITELNWMSVNGWAPRGGSELGTNRHIPSGSDFYAIARNFEEHQVEGLLVVGGWSAYQAALALYNQRGNFPAFNIPIVCLPATIDNDLPGSELSVGADTALNSIMEAVDKIKRSAVASRRVFVIEVMGRRCGYLALMTALATGAERVYMHEEGVTLTAMVADVNRLMEGFRGGKRLGLVIRSEGANLTYSTDFMCSLFREEGGDLFTVRQAILGHLQQGGNPQPFDRILATRLAMHCINSLEAKIMAGQTDSACIGLFRGQIRYTDFIDLPRLMDLENSRPKEQWWLDLRPIAHVLAMPGPNVNGLEL
jgi:6-phosphofructokinase 1